MNNIFTKTELLGLIEEFKSIKEMDNERQLRVSLDNNLRKECIIRGISLIEDHKEWEALLEKSRCISETIIQIEITLLQAYQNI